MPTIAETMMKTITESLGSTLKQEGLAKAREQWLVLNATMSTEDWWPQVARAVRRLFDNFADEQACRQKEQNAAPTNITYVNNSNSNQNNLSNENWWKTNVGKVDQLIGVAEGGSHIIHSKLNDY